MVGGVRLRRVGSASSWAGLELTTGPGFASSSTRRGSATEQHITTKHAAHHLTTRISAHWLAKMLMKRSSLGSLRSANIIFRLSLVVTIVAALMPTIVRLSYGLPGMGSTGLQKAFFASTFLSQLWYVLIILGYMRSAILDYRRRAHCLKRLNVLAATPCHVSNAVMAEAMKGGQCNFATGLLGLLQVHKQHQLKQQQQQQQQPPQKRSSGASTTGGGGVPVATLVTGPSKNPCDVMEVPMLPLLSTDNAVALLLTRRLILKFGLRYFRRIELYQGQTLVS